MIQEKAVDRYSLKCDGDKVEITREGRVLGVVQRAPLGVPELVVETRDSCVVRVHVVQAAAEFLKECLAEQEREKLSRFKHEVEYCFKMGSDLVFDVDVCVNGVYIGSVYHNGGHHNCLPFAVVAAARKFAGWDR